MADNTPEVETAEPETENTEAQTEEEATPEAEAEAAEPDENTENTEVDEEAARQAEARAAEKKKAERFKRISGFFLAILYILVIFVVLFEVGAVYLWMNFDSLMEAQNEQQQQQTTQQTVTSSSYSNWTGTYRPIDWPEPVSDFADAPPYGSIAQPQPDAGVAVT